MLLLDKRNYHDATIPMDSIESVRHRLHGAVKLELATLPPYLTGVFSVKPGQNPEARVLVQSVAIEEMLHLALAANTLVAVGGDPRILAAGRSLRYPGPLPMAIDDSLTVQLRSLTRTQAHEVFMGIEAPDTDAALPGELAPSLMVELRSTHESYESIGDFYTALIRDLETLVAEGKAPFAEPRLDRQVDLAPWFAGELPKSPTGKVHDIETARCNLETIIRQGEGVDVGKDPINPIGDAEGSLAHYFKFGEVYHGKRLVQDTCDPSGWSYTGAAVPLNPDGVYDFPDNPRLGDYPKGSAAAISGEAFYEAYMRLLNGLDKAFNGTPSMLGDAIGTMYELRLVAQQVVQHPADPMHPDGPVAAPPFQR